MGYDQGLPPHGASWPQRSDYDPYSYAYDRHIHAAASYTYYHQPPPPGTEHAAPAVASLSWSSAAGASNNIVVGGPGASPLAVSALPQPTSIAASIGGSGHGVGHPPYYEQQYLPAQHPAVAGDICTLKHGRGNPMYHPLISNAGITSPCGRGRGRGRERGRGRGRGRARGQGRGQGHGSKRSDSQLAIHASGASSASEAQPGITSAPAHMVQATTTNFTQGTVSPAAWCDICRVECNSKEMLEHHENGKKHKRTVQRMQDMARLQGIMPSAIPGMGAPSSTSFQLAEVEDPSAAIHMVPPLGSTNFGGEHKDLAPENVVASVSGVQITEVTASSSKQNTTHYAAAVCQSVEAQVELHDTVQACQPSNEMKDGSEAPPRASGPSNVQLVEARVDVNGNSNGPKRKLTGVGRGAKRLRVSQTPRQRPERVREQPLVCTICNAICDTRAVFDIHLGGKKHQSRLKRSQGPDVLFGPLVAHIPPNQSAAHSTGAPEPLYYGFKSRYTVEQEVCLVGAMQPAFPVLPQTDPSIMAADYPAQPVSIAMDVGNGRPATASPGKAAGGS